MSERWKEIQGFEGKYLISDAGRVKSFLVNGDNSDGFRILKPGVANRGYCKIQLSISRGVRKWFLMHRLVLETFIGKPGFKEECNHINGNKLDNRLDNLEWVSHSSNTIHAYKLGLMQVFRDGRSSRSVLTERDIPEIFNLYKQGLTQKVIADKYCVGRQTITNVLTRNSWGHVQLV